METELLAEWNLINIINRVFSDEKDGLKTRKCSICANKEKGVRAAHCHDVFSAQATREHNDANVLAMGGRVVGPGLALMIVDTFLDTPFSEAERHIRRIAMLED